METNGKFYLGRIFDPQQTKTSEQPLLYEPADLTTHAVVVGMTGSGKTGLCIDLLEEAALNHIPALMIDPKGDITNTLLHFPDLLPQDFQPWVNPDQARRAGKTIEQAAADAAQLWRQGITDWGMDPSRLLALKGSAQFAVFTPGSDAGLPINILASLKAPTMPWESNKETLREKISGTVTALLGLVGMQDVDPVRSREHILLSNIFENAWSQGKDLDLGELILQAQSPPFQKLGVFDVNTFFPEKDRFALAMLLNNILAAPAFQVWIEGQPLDIPSLLYTPDGKPRHSVFYIAHLSDSERMFFITLLYSAVETWMRAQTGTTTLRALVYFDEIFGYLPPVANPPSKQPMLRMLKQARAFGVGQVLVTQNPVDVDYKALSNAGTWMIGKLQTDQDKQRLLDGLESAMAGSLDRSEYDRLISTLGKRVFLVHNVNAKGPALFQTRWAMNYLTGPLTRNQIPDLNQLAGAAWAPSMPFAPAAQPGAVGGQAFGMGSQQPTVERAPASPGAKMESAGFSSTRPTIPAGIDEYFLPNNLTFTQAFKAAGREFPGEAFSQGLIYRPVILCQANARLFNLKYKLDIDAYKTALVENPDRRGVVRWENYLIDRIAPANLDPAPDPQARFAGLEVPLNDLRLMNALQKDFVDWTYRSTQVSVRANEALKLYAGPETTEADFLAQCSQAARQMQAAEAKKASASFDGKLRTLQDKLEREQRELKQDQAELSGRKLEEGANVAETVASLFGIGRKRRISSTLTKRRLTSQAKSDVEESEQAIKDYQDEIKEIEIDREKALQAVNEKWAEVANQITQIPITVQKKDVLLDFFGVAWMPYHLVRAGDQLFELRGFSPR
ncbi:MAG: helicase HerA domain-containing protein [Acidobacteriaceae bacterium]